MRWCSLAHIAQRIAALHDRRHPSRTDRKAHERVVEGTTCGDHRAHCDGHIVEAFGRHRIDRDIGNKFPRVGAIPIEARHKEEITEDASG